MVGVGEVTFEHIKIPPIIKIPTLDEIIYIGLNYI